MLNAILENLETVFVYCSLLRDSEVVVNKTDIIIGKKWLEYQKQLNQNSNVELKILED